MATICSALCRFFIENPFRLTPVGFSQINWIEFRGGGHYTDPATGKRFVLLTNCFMLDAITITQLYKARWQVELFFKWIKQHLRIKAFYGTSPNAVKTQIWIAVCVYVLVAIIAKEQALDRKPSEILQILGIMLFEKVPVHKALAATPQNVRKQANITSWYYSISNRTVVIRHRFIYGARSRDGDGSATEAI